MELYEGGFGGLVAGGGWWGIDYAEGGKRKGWAVDLRGKLFELGAGVLAILTVAIITIFTYWIVSTYAAAELKQIAPNLSTWIADPTSWQAWWLIGGGAFLLVWMVHFARLGILKLIARNINRSHETGGHLRELDVVIQT